MKTRNINSYRDRNGLINLNKLEACKEKNIFIEGSHAKAWFKVDNTRFLFKEYNNKLLAFAEVLYSKIASEANINCAEYDFACYGGKIGTISYDFIEEGETFFSALDLTSRFMDNKFDKSKIKEDLDLISLYNLKYNNYNTIKELLENIFNLGKEEKLKMRQDLIKMFTLDTILWHQDRNLWNYGVLVNDETAKMRMAPVFDNSDILFLDRGEKYIENIVVDALDRKSGSMIKEKLRNVFDLKDDFNMNQLLDFYSSNNEDVKKIIKSIIGSINTEEIVNKVNRIYDVGIINTTWIKTIINYRIEYLLNGIKEIDNMKSDDKKTINVSFYKRK